MAQARSFLFVNIPVCVHNCTTSNVPTVAEFVPGCGLYIWGGFVAPKDKSQDFIAKLNEDIKGPLAEAEVKAKLAALGAEPLVLSSSDFGKFIADEAKKLGRWFAPPTSRPIDCPFRR
jgi:tripartite-type tricarboxylate transporter receptor subunit TctC